MDVLGDGYKIHLFDLISDEVYIYLFGDYLDSEGLEVDYLLAYLAYCFFYILYTGEALDVKTTLSGYFFMSISQASNISIFDLQFCHDFIYIFGNSSHNYSLNFYLNFDEDFIITTMGFSSYVNKITRALLNEKSIFSLDIHGNFYYRSEA